jgi:hypothetical protein
MDERKLKLLLAAAPLALALLLLPSAGCGGGTAPSGVPVKGKVTVGNQPLKDGQVVFHPDPKKNTTTIHVARGEVVNGVYELKSEAGGEGTPVGWYKVTVHTREKVDPKDEYSLPKSLGFEDPKSGIPMQVVENPKPGAYDITLP